MSIKILGGVAKGFTLTTPQNSHTRPTSVLLKRRLFDSIQNFSGFIFYDICAGSGAVGFEALSRGADKVFFWEKSFKNIQVIKENASNLKKKYPLLNDYQIEKVDFSKLLKKTDFSENNSFLFFDPPYESIDMYQDFFDQVKELQFHGKVVVEACTQKTLDLNSFQSRFGKANKLIKQGTSYFAIYDY